MLRSTVRTPEGRMLLRIRSSMRRRTTDRARANPHGADAARARRRTSSAPSRRTSVLSVAPAAARNRRPPSAIASPIGAFAKASQDRSRVTRTPIVLRATAAPSPDPADRVRAVSAERTAILAAAPAVREATRGAQFRRGTGGPLRCHLSSYRWYASLVTAPLEAEFESTHDEAGVDLTLIRETLALTPVERLQRLQQFIDSVIEIRNLNARRPVR